MEPTTPLIGATEKEYENRLGVLLIKILPEEIRQPVMERHLRPDQPVSTLLMLEAVMERFSPGGTSEMSSLLNFQRNLPAANSYRELLDTLRKYDIARMRTEHLNLPGLPPHEVIKSLDSMTKLLEKRNPSLAMRLNLVRMSPEILVPSDLGITRLMAMLLQEGRRLQAEDEVARNRANQGVQIEQPSASQAVSSKGGKGGSERNPKDIICKFHLSERGCVKGSACEYSHAAPKKGQRQGKRSRCKIRKGPKEADQSP